MTTPTQPGTNITKLDQTDDFKTLITDVINALPKTAQDSALGTNIGQNPFQSGAPVPGFAFNSSNYGATPPLTAGQTVTTAPQASSVPGANVAASALITLFQNTATTLSRVRRYTMQKTIFGAVSPSLSLGFPANVVGVNVGGNTFTVAGNFISGAAAANFQSGTTFTITGNSLSAANKTYTVVGKALSGLNTDITVSPGTIPAGTGTNGQAQPDRYAHLTSTYQTTPTVSLSGNITATGLDAVVNTVNAAIAAHRNTTVNFTETWCHSSCHSNHSSRGRR